MNTKQQLSAAKQKRSTIESCITQHEELVARHNDRLENLREMRRMLNREVKRLEEEAMPAFGG